MIHFSSGWMNHPAFHDAARRYANARRLLSTVESLEKRFGKPLDFVAKQLKRTSEDEYRNCCWVNEDFLGVNFDLASMKRLGFSSVEQSQENTGQYFTGYSSDNFFNPKINKLTIYPKAILSSNFCDFFQIKSNQDLSSLLNFVFVPHERAHVFQNNQKMKYFEGSKNDSEGVLSLIRELQLKAKFKCLNDVVQMLFKNDSEAIQVFFEALSPDEAFLLTPLLKTALIEHQAHLYQLSWPKVTEPVIQYARMYQEKCETIVTSVLNRTKK